MTVRKWLTALFLVAVCAATAMAQTDQGRFTGTVRDSSGAFVAGATVKVKNERTGEEREVLTNQQGYFLLGSLKPSSYTIRAEKGGFAAIEYTSMPIAVGQELNLDFEFKPAGVQETVTVVGSAPVLDVSSAHIGVNVSERDVNRIVSDLCHHAVRVKRRITQRSEPFQRTARGWTQDRVLVGLSGTSSHGA